MVRAAPDHGRVNAPPMGRHAVCSLPPRFCTHSNQREHVAKERPSDFYLFSFPSCPSPRKLVHIDLRIRHCQWIELHEPLERKQTELLLVDDKTKAHFKESVPRSHCRRNRSRTQVFWQKVIESSPLIKDFLETYKKNIKGSLEFLLKFC